MGRRHKRGHKDLQPDPGADFDPATELRHLVARERGRSGPGSAARRALEALADRRRLRRQLDDLDDF